MEFQAERFLEMHRNTLRTSCAFYDSMDLKGDSTKRSPENNVLYLRFQTISFVFCLALFVIVFDIVDRPEMLFLLGETAPLFLPTESFTMLATVIRVLSFIVAGRLSKLEFPEGRTMLLVLGAVPGLRGSIETRNVDSTRSTANGCEAAGCRDFSASIALRERDRCGSDDLWYQWLDVEVLRLCFLGVGLISSLSLLSMIIWAGRLRFCKAVAVVGRAVTTEEGPAASCFLSADQEARAEEAVLGPARFANLSASI